MIILKKAFLVTMTIRYKNILVLCFLVSKATDFRDWIYPLRQEFYNLKHFHNGFSIQYSVANNVFVILKDLFYFVYICLYVCCTPYACLVPI